MNPKIRMAVLASLVALCIIALVVLSIFGMKNVEQIQGVIQGVLGTSAAGVLDSLAVAKRERGQADRQSGSPPK